LGYNIKEKVDSHSTHSILPHLSYDTYSLRDFASAIFVLESFGVRCCNMHMGSSNLARKAYVELCNSGGVDSVVPLSYKGVIAAAAAATAHVVAAPAPATVCATCTPTSCATSVAFASWTFSYFFASLYTCRCNVFPANYKDLLNEGL